MGYPSNLNLNVQAFEYKPSTAPPAPVVVAEVDPLTKKLTEQLKIPQEHVKSL
jgi:hypothetical protein